MFGKQKFTSESAKLLLLSTTKMKPALCNAFVFRPEKDRERLGKLLLLIKIDEDTNDNREILRGIVDILKSEYYRFPDHEAEENLERGLIKVNEILKELAALGKIGWVSKLHALAVSLTDSQICLSQTGEMIPLLIRDGTANLIQTEQNEPNNIQSIKSFTGITSGSLKSNDRLVFATSSLLEFFSAEKLIQILCQKQLSDAKQYIQKLIFEQIKAEETVASIFVCLKPIKENYRPQRDLPTDSPLSPPDQLDDTTEEILENSQPTQKAVQTQTLPAHQPVYQNSIQKRIEAKRRRHFPYSLFYGLFILGKWLGRKALCILRSSFRLHIKVLKGIRSLGVLVAVTFQGGAKKLWAKRKGKESRQIAVTAPVETKSPEPSKLTPHFSSFKAQKIRKSFIFLLNVLFYPLRALGHLSRLPLKFKIAAATVPALICVALVSFYFFGERWTRRAPLAQDQQDTENLNTAQTKSKEAVDAMIYKDREKAVKLLEEADGLVRQVLGSETHRAQAMQLQAEIQAQFDKINQIDRIAEPTLVVDLGKIKSEIAPLELVGLKNELFTFSAAENLILRIDYAKKEAIQLSPDFANIGHLQKGCPFDQEKNILFVNQEGEFVLFNLDTFKMEEMEAQPPFTPNTLVECEDYGTKVYTLNPDQNQIVKYERTLAGLSKGTPWLADDSDLFKATSLALDGNIFVATREGKILKLHSGKAQEFNLPALNPPLTAPNKIFTRVDYKNLYILDPPQQRVLVLSKEDNQLVKQFISAAFLDLKDLWVPPEENNIYVLGGQKIWEIALNP